MKRLKVTKKITLAAAGAIVVGVLGGVAAMNNPAPTKATDSPLVQQVDSQSKELDNHEARITNTENDVKDLQNKTGTPPTSNKVNVPPVTAPAQTQQTTPQTIIVASFEQIDEGGGNMDCKFTYSDGTTYQWHWKTVNPQGSWQTDSFGQNGHWTESMQTTGSCASQDIGEQRN